MSPDAGPSTWRDRIKFCDGGMGTTLREHGLKVENPLWGTDLVVTNPTVVEDVHRRFIDAGSDIIQTNTYQLTGSSLKDLASGDETQGVFDHGIKLASQAIAHSANPQTGIALSLGSLGSTLGEAQEYTGVYPPPYGPSTDITDEGSMIEAIASWHLDRLRIYARTPSWSSVQWLAFETVPLLREIIAIRRAMRCLNEEGAFKKFWIACPFPQGQFPGNGTPVTTEDVLRAACAHENGGGLPANGAGINCTHPRYTPELATQYTRAFMSLVDQGVLDFGTVTMILYPDGGMSIDAETHQLHSENMTPSQWSGNLATTVHHLETASGPNTRKVWSGVIVGGCCGTLYEHIRELTGAVDSIYSDRGS